MRPFIFTVFFISAILFTTVNAQVGFWTQVTNLAPDKSGGGMQLMSDGTILCKSISGGSDGYGSIWNKLTPDASGSYINGTWSSISAMANTRLYFSSQILKDGRIYVAGGEYGSGGSDAEVYDPFTNTWTGVTPQPSNIGDANSTILSDGRVLQSLVTGFSQTTVIYDPLTNSYLSGPSTISAYDESSWLKQPDNSILFVDFSGTTSERYIPAINQWTADATVPVNLYDPIIGETGPALLLPDGRSFYIGATNQTAYYTPSGNTSPGSWTAGPNIPSNSGAPDAPAAMMPNGKILCVVSPTPTSTNNFPPPTSFYEFDYLTNSFTSILAPGGGSSLNQPCYIYNLIVLPDGKILLSTQNLKKYWVYTPSGSQLVAGTPTVSNIIQSGCTSFTATGMLFNGISDGACYGDDWQTATNFPIIRLTAGANVYYCTTKNWNSRGVMRGTTPDSTEFILPPGLPAATYSLQVIANGIASLPFPFTPYPVLSVSSNYTLCSGSTTTLNVSGANTYTWNTGSNATSIIVSPTITTNYTVSGTNAGGCNSTDSVLVTVNTCLSINELNFINTLNVFPNPAQEEVTLQFHTNETGNYTINVIDVYGRIVKNEFDTAVSGENSHTVLLNNIDKGMYFIIVQKGSTISKTKVVIE